MTTMLSRDRSVSGAIINAWSLGRMAVHPGRSLSAPYYEIMKVKKRTNRYRYSRIKVYCETLEALKISSL